MADKKTIKRLISKGLTGREAGLLTFHDNWEVDHGRPDLLSKSDFEKMRASLKDNQDISDYNRMVDAYRAVDYTLKAGLVICLEARENLNLATSIGEKYFMLNTVKMARIQQPVLMTEKEYQEKKAKQREEKLQEKLNLFQAANIRAAGIATEEQLQEADDDIEMLLINNEEIGDRAAEDILKALPADLEFQGEKISEIMDRANERGKLSTEDAADLFLEIELTGEQLYQTGLPEFVDWIDKYQYEQAAIIMNPSPELLDDKGYYTGEDGLQWLETLAENRVDIYEEKHVNICVNTARGQIKVFLAIAELFQTISELFGFSLMEDIDRQYELLESDVEQYNRAAKPSNITQYYPPEWNVSKISLAKLKPDKSEIEYLRERMAASLGEGWWTEKYSFEVQEDIRLAIKQLVTVRGEE